MWARLFGLPCSYFQPTYFVGAKGGGIFLGVAMLGGDSFCMDDSLGMEDPQGNDDSQYISDPMPQGDL